MEKIMLKLFNISDGYIEYLRQEHKHVYSNKEHRRSHERKYIGTVLTINNYNYFVPLSSPKDNNYWVKDGNYCIKPDSFVVWHIKDKSELKATLHFEDMIPVPSSEIELYNIREETDENYKAVIFKEIEYIRKKEAKIIKRANVVYKNKVSGNSLPVYRGCLDYKALEQMHDIWVGILK